MKLSWLMFLGVVTCGGFATAKEKNANDIKVLVLVIASDQLPVYVEEQKIWRSYMHLDPEHVEAYFIRGDPHLPEKYVIENDIIWSKTEEGWIKTSAGILNKTLLSLEAMLPRLSEFDYVLRTNLSSFYIFPRLLEFLKTLPKEKCYCGSSIGGDNTIASGCGFILSPDVAKMLVEHQSELFNNRRHEDDVLIGSFLMGQGLCLKMHNRVDLQSIESWNQQIASYSKVLIGQVVCLIAGRHKNPFSSSDFHFRTRNHNDKLRSTDEVFIQRQLLRVFYNK